MHFLTQPPQDARFGDVHGSDRQPRFTRSQFRRYALKHVPSKDKNCLWFELVGEHFEQVRQQVTVVLLFPVSAELATRIFEPGGHLLELFPTGGAVAPFAPERLEAVGQDGAEPVTEGTPAAIVLEIVQSAASAGVFKR